MAAGGAAAPGAVRLPSPLSPRPPPPSPPPSPPAFIAPTTDTPSEGTADVATASLIVLASDSPWVASAPGRRAFGLPPPPLAAKMLLAEEAPTEAGGGGGGCSRSCRAGGLRSGRGVAVSEVLLDALSQVMCGVAPAGRPSHGIQGGWRGCKREHKGPV